MSETEHWTKWHAGFKCAECGYIMSTGFGSYCCVKCGCTDLLEAAVRHSTIEYKAHWYQIIPDSRHSQSEARVKDSYKGENIEGTQG